VTEDERVSREWLKNGTFWNDGTCPTSSTQSIGTATTSKPPSCIVRSESSFTSELMPFPAVNGMWEAYLMNGCLFWVSVQSGTHEGRCSSPVDMLWDLSVAHEKQLKLGVPVLIMSQTAKRVKTSDTSALPLGSVIRCQVH
jgi:hypothetical protein